MLAPRVSVLLPIHDPGPFLRPALESVLRQTLARFEVICVDDGSTDGTPAVLREFGARDGRIRVLSPGRVGLVAAANLARSAAQAPYLARFDADDVMHRRRLELQEARLRERPDLDVVSSLVRHFPKDSVREGNRVYEAWLNGVCSHEEIARDIFVESPLPNPSTMIRAQAFDRLGGYRETGGPEDYDFWLRAWASGMRFEKVERVLHFWRDHPGRVTRTDPRYSLEAFLQTKARFLLRGPLGGDRPFVVWGAGMTGRRLTRILVRAQRPPLALLDIDPAKVGRTRQGRPILPPEATDLRGVLVLGAVGARHARAQIRERLLGRGLRETKDFWMVA